MMDYEIDRMLNGKLADIKTHCILWYDKKIKCHYCDITDINKLTIHHISYNLNSIIYLSYGNSLTGRITYYSNLLDEIIDHPDNFITLCNRCHALLHLHNKNKVLEGQKVL